MASLDHIFVHRSGLWWDWATFAAAHLGGSQTIHPDAAGPAEALLSAMGSGLVTAGQVKSHVCDQIEAVLGGADPTGIDHTGVPFCETPGPTEPRCPYRATASED